MQRLPGVAKDLIGVLLLCPRHTDQRDNLVRQLGSLDNRKLNFPKLVVPFRHANFNE